MQVVRWCNDPLNLPYLMIGAPLLLSAAVINKLGIAAFQTPVGLVWGSAFLVTVEAGIELAVAIKVARAAGLLNR